MSMKDDLEPPDEPDEDEGGDEDGKQWPQEGGR